MDDYQFLTLVILLIGAIVSPLLTWLKDRNARKLDNEKVAALQKSVDALRSNLDNFNKNVTKYLKLVKDRNETDFLLGAADLALKAEEKKS